MINIVNVSKFNNPKKDSHTRYFTTLEDGTKLEVASVTTILSLLGDEFLLSWSNWLGTKGIDYKEFLQRMANVGTVIHDSIETFGREDAIHPFNHPLIHQDPKISSMVTNAYQAYMSWYGRHSQEPILREESMVSNKYYYGGTIDYFGKVDKVVTLIDYKTSNFLSFKYLLQLIGYCIMLKEDGTYDKIEQIGILRLSKKNIEYEYILIPYHEVEFLEPLFIKLVDMFYSVNALKADWEDMMKRHTQLG